MNTQQDCVREQYELFPYPRRNPVDERENLMATSLDALEQISHYCFRGQLDPNGMRVLVVGGGTGDATIFLAEQLRDFKAEVVYLDLSEASLQIARQRAIVRNLENIKWIRGSIMELSHLDLGKFDYINCSGVLHHLEDPAAGLAVLTQMLSDRGAMGIMMYGKYGRTTVYHIQQLMRMINQPIQDLHQKIENLEHVLAFLPHQNWWFLRDHIRWNNEIKNNGESGLVDLYLHSQDRAYSVLELHALIEDSGLQFVSFFGWDDESPASYLPETYIKDRYLLRQIQALPIKTQQAIAELVVGRMRKHSFYVSMHSQTIASLDDTQNIPYLYNCNVTGREIAEAIRVNPGKPIQFSIKDVCNTSIVPQKFTKEFMYYMDGKSTLGEIGKKVNSKLRKKQAVQKILMDFKPVFETLSNNAVMCLRHESTKEFPSLKQYTERVRNL